MNALVGASKTRVNALVGASKTRVNALVGASKTRVNALVARFGAARPAVHRGFTISNSPADKRQRSGK